MKVTADLAVSDAILHFFESRAGCSGTVIIAAFSGGSDSSALLHGLWKTADRTGIRLHAAYVDHGLRGTESSNRELDAVTRQAEELKIPLHVKRFPAGLILRDAERLRKSIEAQAREMRYEFLQSTASALEKKYLRNVYIAVGHHSDDFLETAVMAFLQGAGIAGVTGISEVNGRIIRPLLRVGKEKIREYITQNNIRIVEDPTNTDIKYFRNRVRHNIIPVLKEEYPGIVHSVFSGAEKAKIAESFIDEETRKTIVWNPEHNSGSKKYRTALDNFIKASPVVKLRALYTVYDYLRLGTDDEKRFPYRFIRPLIYCNTAEELKNVLSGGLSGHGILINVDGSCLSVRIDEAATEGIGFLISVMGGKTCRLGRFTIEIVEAADSSGSGGEIYLNLNGCHPVITHPLPKDRIKTDRGNTPVRKIFSEQKIPFEMRDQIPILRDETGIAGVMTGPFGGADIFGDKITVQTPGDGYKMYGRKNVYIIKGNGQQPIKVVIQDDYAEPESK
ncbi:MAG: tRNA lysidine(34) synthetase TilS [Spirochaetia bacterium]